MTATARPPEGGAIPPAGDPLQAASTSVRPSAPPRVAFLTIGQAPRSDVVPEMAEVLGADVTVDEFGVLDEATDAELAALAPRTDGAYRFATRLRDGRQIELDKVATEARLAALMQRIDGRGYDVLVPLCTGTAIPRLATLVLEPQQVVDHLLAALSVHARRIGLMLPLREQLEGFHLAVPLACEVSLAHASPYESDRARAREAFRQAGAALADCDVVVMHCMGYAAWMHAEVQRASGRPTLLSNRIVADALAQLLARA
ncbi:AroM family protein [Verticiella sediminum]|uniref:AroM family protein n=1 Tax=Verticiella sediminum TaxID=1247510 RepID=A0A556A6E0_9BURK|nr:AroM family protein [Verticiella sediminum]TSH88449.1 AroM family protein [Verticiella sediminum]